MNLNKEEEIFRKRIEELTRKAETRNICTYTDFLNLNEINIFLSMHVDTNYILFGGYDGAERKVICFYGEESVKAFSNFITCVRIQPINKKFSDQLTHRDFLGAILNLGIERSKVGDILIKDNVGFVFCETTISHFILDSLVKIKNTNVSLDIIEEDNIDIQPSYKEIRGTVSSARLDSVIALAFQSSRSSILGLISGGKVFVNSKLIESNSYMLKENDIVSVRGNGKFKYIGMENQTKKGRYYITLLRYI